MSDIITSKEHIFCEIPPFLRNSLRTEYGAEAERIFAGYACRRPVTLRANELKATAEEIAKAFDELGIAFERVDWYKDAFLLPLARKEQIEATELYRQGKIYLQSLSSMLPPLLLAPKAGETVLDMAAAPGGKTTQLAALSGGKAPITSCEKDKLRFERLKFNLARQSATRVNAMCLDASKLDDFFRFDKILLDAPCSGSGTVFLGKRVDFSEKLLAGCMRSQEALLRKALAVLKEGGELIYSTCSVLKEENEKMLERVIQRSDARVVPISGPFLEELPILPSAPGTVTVCPDEKFEGFFLAKLTK